MFNLVIKDIVIQKKNFLLTFFYTVFFSFTFSSFKPASLGLYVVAPILVCFMFISNAATYDDKNKSELVLNSLPLKRADIVIAKYISVFIYIIISITYSVLIGFIGKTAGLSIYNISISPFNIISVLTSICIFSCIFFPLYFKFGIIKIQMLILIPFMLIFSIIILAINYATKNPNNILVQKFTNTSVFTQNSLALTIGLIIFLISIMISIRIYKNKEF